MGHGSVLGKTPQLPSTHQSSSMLTGGRFCKTGVPDQSGGQQDPTQSLAVVLSTLASHLSSPLSVLSEVAP